MVGIMASAYKGLTEEEQERVFLLATGKEEFSDLDSNFCKGFAACHDESLDPWWNTWGANQRDVYFYIKNDPNDDDSWEYYCRYSMNSNNAEFDDTIREMLAVTAPVIEEVTVGGEEASNAASNTASNTAVVLESPIPKNNATTSGFPVFVTEPLVEEETVEDEEETSNTTAGLAEPLVEEVTVEDEEESNTTVVSESSISEDSTTSNDFPVLAEPLIEDEEETSNTTLALESSIPEDSTTVSVPNAPVPIVSENMNDTSSSNFISISSTLSLLVLVVPFLRWFTLL